MKMKKKLASLIALSIIIAYIIGPITAVACGIFINATETEVNSKVTTTIKVESKSTPIIVEKPIAKEEPVVEKPTLLSLEEIVKEVINGKWGSGEERKQALEKAGYNYEEIQKTINKQQPSPKKIVSKTNKSTKHNYTGKLTKSGGVYYNPYTGLKETWYSQRVLPGGGLKIPGRHVNSEGFVCDKDGYICVASNDYKKGTIIETSRGMGKVYDCGCASGILDLYVNW